jgi:hypothetical protein
VTGAQAAVVVRRVRGFWRDGLRRYRVRLDGQWVGKLEKDEEAIFDVGPGAHELQVNPVLGLARRSL